MGLFQLPAASKVTGNLTQFVDPVVGSVVLGYIVNDDPVVGHVQQVGDAKRAAVQAEERATLDRLMRDVFGVFGQPLYLADDGLGRFGVLAGQFTQRRLSRSNLSP